MSEVKRYDPFGYDEMFIAETGDFVLATDYDALHAEAGALRAENARLRTALTEQGER